MKLLVTGIEHPQLIKSWSGIPHHLSQALGAHFELCFFGGLKGPATTLHTWIGRFYRRLGLGEYRIRSEPAVLREFAQGIEKTIDREKPDAILSIGFEPIAYLDPGLPAYIIHDATFRLLLQYPHFQSLGKRSRLTGEKAQIRGFERATRTFAASEWARESACRDYAQPAQKVTVIPLGANLSDPPGASEVAAAIERRLISDRFDFLFIGVEWARKGGDTAVSIVESLVRLGLNAHLHVVGCPLPPAVRKKTFVQAYGFLSKGHPADAAKLRGLFEMARFLIVPSLAECFGCVFCEADAFGLPCISRETGGIPNAIRSGVTGFLLSEKLPEQQIVSQVLELSRNPARYREMALNARRDYEDRLNWDAYARRLKEILTDEPAGAMCPTPILTST